MKAPLVLDRRSYFSWAEAQSRGNYERVCGEVVEMSPERWEHARLKAEIQYALRAALAEVAGCRVTPDGMTVAIGKGHDFVPDVAIHCGDPIPRDSLVIPNPVVVIEVLSPATTRIDTIVKREGYLSVPSIAHYLIFRADRRQVTHWRRDVENPTRRSGGWLRLDPPGVTLDLDAIHDTADAQ